MIGNIVLFPYWLALRVRHLFYDKGWRKRREHPVPVISVGNVTVGGTGKTPMVEYLVALLQGRCRVAVLSRGYKRKGRGFHRVTPEDTALAVGDEPLQMCLKYPQVLVAVDRNRNHGVRRLLELPENERPDLVILDDGFQYRALKPAFEIALVDYNRPVYDDSLMPIGHLRDLPGRLRCADVVVVTKVPGLLDEAEREEIRRKLRLREDQPLLFAGIRYGNPLPVFEKEADKRYVYSQEVYLFSGIADDRPLLDFLYDRYAFIEHRRFGDHHRFTRADERALLGYVRKHPRTLLLTTEKDAMRLLNCSRLDDEVRRRLFYLPIRTAFLTWDEGSEFDGMIRKTAPEKAFNGLLF